MENANNPNIVALNDFHNHDFIYAKTFSRFLASLIDFVLLVASALLLNFGLVNILKNTPAAINAYHSWHDVYLETGLYYEKENGELDLYTFTNYLEYEEKVYNFYSDYLGNRCPEPKKDYYDVYWYNVFVYGQDDLANKYSKNELDNRYSRVLKEGKDLFEYKDDGSGNKIVSEFAILKSSATQEKACNYYDPIVNGERQGSASIYQMAVVELVSSPWFLARYEYYVKITSSTSNLISFTITILVFRYIIPLFSKYRKSLGKRLTRIGIIDENGKELNKIRFSFRELVPLAFYITVFCVAAFGFSKDIIFLITFLAIGLLSLIIVFATKKHRAFHDMIAKSFVVDLDKSITKETKSRIQIIGANNAKSEE